MLLCISRNPYLTKIESWHTDESLCRWCNNRLIIVFHTNSCRSRNATVIPTGGNPCTQDLSRYARRFGSELNRGRFPYWDVSP